MNPKYKPNFLSVLIIIMLIATGLYIAGTTILLWYKAGLIYKFIVANAMCYIITVLIKPKDLGMKEREPTNK